MDPFWEELSLSEGALRPDTLTSKSYERPTIVTWLRPHMENPGDLYGQWRFHVPQHGVVATVRLFAIPNRREEFAIVARVASEKDHPYFSDPTLQGAAGKRFQAAFLRILQMAVTMVDYPSPREALRHAPKDVVVHRTTPKGVVGYHMVIGSRKSRKMLRDQGMVAVEVNSFAATAARRAGFTLRHQDYTDAANREMTEMIDVQNILGEDEDDPNAVVTNEQLLRVAEVTARHSWRLYRSNNVQDDILSVLTELQETFYVAPVNDKIHQAFCFVHSLLNHQLLTEKKTAASSLEEPEDAFYYYDEESSTEEEEVGAANPSDEYWLSLQVTELARQFSGDRTDLFVETASASTAWKPNQKAPSPHFALLMNKLHEKHPPISAFFQALFDAIQPRSASTEFCKPAEPVNNEYLATLEHLIASLDPEETWVMPLLHKGAFLRPDAPVYITEVFLDYMKKSEVYHIDPLYRMPRFKHLMMDHEYSARKTKSLLERFFF